VSESLGLPRRRDEARGARRSSKKIRPKGAKATPQAWATLARPLQRVNILWQQHQFVSIRKMAYYDEAVGN